MFESLRPAGRPSMFDSLLPAAAAAIAAGAVGCSVSMAPPSLEGAGEALDLTTQALSVGAIHALDGTYGANCVSRSGPWSLRLSGAEALDHPAVSVVKDNSECVLTVTHVVVDATYALATPLVLAASYDAVPAAVNTGGSPLWVKAKLASASMSDSLFVTLLFSDSPSVLTSSLSASYASVSASGSSSEVLAPTYTADLETGMLKVEVTASKAVTSASGSARLVPGAVTGSAYTVYAGALSSTPSFVEVDAAYHGGTPTSISGTPVIAASAFGLVGQSLASAIVRTVIVRGGTSDLPTYEVLRITFNPPS